MTLSDLANHCSTFDDAISTTYRRHRIWECPPNGQGITTLMALNILEGFEIGEYDARSPEVLHIIIEALRLAFADARRPGRRPGQIKRPGRRDAQQGLRRQTPPTDLHGPDDRTRRLRLPARTIRHRLPLRRRRRRQRLLLHQLQLRGFRQRHRPPRLRLQPPEPRRRIRRRRPRPSQRPRRRQAPLPHDHALDDHPTRRQPLRQLRRDGRLEPASGPDPGRAQPDRPRHGRPDRDRRPPRLESTRSRPTAPSTSRTPSASKSSPRSPNSATRSSPPAAPSEPESSAKARSSSETPNEQSSGEAPTPAQTAAPSPYEAPNA